MRISSGMRSSCLKCHRLRSVLAPVPAAGSTVSPHPVGHKLLLHLLTSPQMSLHHPPALDITLRMDSILCYVPPPSDLAFSSTPPTASWSAHMGVITVFIPENHP